MVIAAAGAHWGILLLQRHHLQLLGIPISSLAALVGLGPGLFVAIELLSEGVALIALALAARKAQPAA